jgi:hypothetical protein
LRTDQGHGVDPIGQRGFQAAKTLAFQPQQSPFRAARVRGIVEPLLAVHVDQVDHRGDAVQAGNVQVLDHARAKGKGDVKPRALGPLVDGPAQGRRPEQALGCGSSRQEGSRGTQPAGAPIPGNRGHALTDPAQHDHRLRLHLAVREERQRHVGAGRQEAEQMERADPVSTIRRIRNAVSQK